MIYEGKFQIGKNGVASGAIDSLSLALKTHSQIRISVLKSSKRDKNSIRQMADEIIQKVSYPCNYRIIGFTIILRKRSGVKTRK